MASIQSVILFLTRVAATFFLTALPVAGHATLIWHERGVASVTSGYQVDTGEFVNHKFYVAAIGPDGFQGAAHGAARTCVEGTVKHIGDQFRGTLRKLKPAVSGDTQGKFDKAAHERDAAALDAAIDNIVNSATQSFREHLSACARGRFDARQFDLALVLRICDPRSGECENKATAFADHESAIAYTALSLWVDARDGKHNTLPANHPVILPNVVDTRTTLKRMEASTPSEALQKCQQEVAKRIPATAPRPITCLTLEMAARPVKESNPWGDSPPPAVAQAQIEGLAVKARELGKRIDRSVPRTVDIPHEIALRFVDVLDEPQQALLELKEAPGAKLLTIQDELARSRVIECARFRAVADDQISACAGYKLDALTVDQCLAGASCVPEFGKEIWAGSALQFEVGGRKELAEGGLLPRTGIRYPQLVADANTCAKAPNREAAAACMLKLQLGDREKAAWACVKGKNPSQLDAKSVECAVGSALPTKVVAAIDCARQFKKSEDQAICALKGALPPEAGAMIECQRKHPNDARDIALCMARKLGGDAGLAVACLEQARGDWAKGAQCYGSDKLPTEVAQAIGCVQNSGGGAAPLAGCVAASQLPENLRKPAQCIAESGGDPFGAGICMASDGLTPDQRIALQCLASTGGEPVSFATCTGGRLAVKEMFNCVDKKLFEGNCMGKGNELVKLADALGINLSPNTAVGMALNVPRDVVVFQVAAAQATIKGIQNLSGNLQRELDRAGQEISRIGEQVRKDIQNGIDWVGDRLGIRF